MAEQVQPKTTKTHQCPVLNAWWRLRVLLANSAARPRAEWKAMRLRVAYAKYVGHVGRAFRSLSMRPVNMATQKWK
jgi:hypothetical protein